MTWTITEVPWEHPAAVALRAAQREELDRRYGSDDHEPGTPPSGADVPVFLVALDEQGGPVGCGGLRALDDAVLGPHVMEVKRMFVDAGSRGSGVAAAILRALEVRARELGAVRLVLETGTLQPEAVRFYSREGYESLPPFGAYEGSPWSVCFGRWLVDDGPAAPAGSSTA
jgi:GNAT superfamily N-acetyltransferase